jgi:hypothetical protein
MQEYKFTKVTTCWSSAKKLKSGWQKYDGQGDRMAYIHGCNVVLLGGDEEFIWLFFGKLK